MFRFAAGSQVSAISHELFELFLITDSEGIGGKGMLSNAAILFFSSSDRSPSLAEVYCYCNCARIGKQIPTINTS